MYFPYYGARERERESTYTTNRFVVKISFSAMINLQFKTFNLICFVVLFCVGELFNYLGIWCTICGTMHKWAASSTITQRMLNRLELANFFGNVWNFFQVFTYNFRHVHTTLHLILLSNVLMYLKNFMIQLCHCASQFMSNIINLIYKSKFLRRKFCLSSDSFFSFSTGLINSS